MAGLNLGLGSAGIGASEALEKLLAQRFLERQQRARELAEGHEQIYRMRQLDALEGDRRARLEETARAHREAETDRRERSDLVQESRVLQRMNLYPRGTQVPHGEFEEASRYGLRPLFTGDEPADVTLPHTHQFAGTQQQANTEAAQELRDRIADVNEKVRTGQLDVATARAEAARISADAARERAGASGRVTAQDRLAALSHARRDAAAVYNSMKGPTGKVVGPDGRPVSPQDVYEQLKGEYLGMLDAGTMPTAPVTAPPSRAPQPGRIQLRPVAPRGGAAAGPKPVTGLRPVPSEAQLASVMRAELVRARAAQHDRRPVTDQHVATALAIPGNREFLRQQLAGPR